MAKKEEGFRILVESPELDEELELPGNYADDRPFLQKASRLLYCDTLILHNIYYKCSAVTIIA